MSHRYRVYTFRRSLHLSLFGVPSDENDERDKSEHEESGNLILYLEVIKLGGLQLKPLSKVMTAVHSTAIHFSFASKKYGPDLGAIYEGYLIKRLNFWSYFMKTYILQFSVVFSEHIFTNDARVSFIVSGLCQTVAPVVVSVVVAGNTIVSHIGVSIYAVNLQTHNKGFVAARMTNGCPGRT